MSNFRYLRPFVFVLMILLVASGAAVAQADFTLSVSPLNPSAVDPGVSAIATVTVSPLNGFSGSVALQCPTISPALKNGPSCSFTTPSVDPPATPTLTVGTTAATPPGNYQITVAGTGRGITHSVPLNFNVVAVSPAFTIPQPVPLTPSSVQVGNAATTTITVSSIGGFAGSVTLSCSSFMMNGVAATGNLPTCAFSNPGAVVTPPANGDATALLTVNTVGTTSRLAPPFGRPRLYYAFLGPIFGLALLGAGSRAFSSRCNKLIGVLILSLLATGLLFVPACGGGSSTTTTSGTATTTGTYTITIEGSSAGVIESGAPPTLTLTVN